MDVILILLKLLGFKFYSSADIAIDVLSYHMKMIITTVRLLLRVKWDNALHWAWQMMCSINVSYYHSYKSVQMSWEVYTKWRSQDSSHLCWIPRGISVTTAFELTQRFFLVPSGIALDSMNFRFRFYTSPPSLKLPYLHLASWTSGFPTTCNI